MPEYSLVLDLGCEFFFIVVFTFYRLVEWQVNLQSRDRSKSFDEKNSVKLPSYKGDNVNKEPDDKENNVKKQNFLLSSYKRDKGDNLACLPTMKFVLK